jgi:cytochrome c553
MRLAACTLAVLLLQAARLADAQTAVTLPIEVVGENGSTASVTVDVPSPMAGEVRYLRTEIHGLAYADMVSVQVNSGAWVPLNNHTVEVAGLGRTYGGIGGSFATLQVTLPLTANSVAAGPNAVRFRFNRTNGLVSGFRVLGFNFLTAASNVVLPPTTFVHEDPQRWTPPLTDPDSIRAGKRLWETAPLSAGSFQDSPPIRARCADCHTRDGRDLKYFSYSNISIIARSRFHGLSEQEGRQIASYIRSLPVPSPGRPWNPPYQPGPGLDRQPVANWAAGAGLAAVLDDDNGTLPFLLAADAPLHPDGNLNVREIPIAFQLPDWNHWLPQIHPLDAWGVAFEKSEFAAWYDSGAAPSRSSLRGLLAASDAGAFISSGRIVTAFDKWRDARRALLRPAVEGKSVDWTPALSVKAYSTQLWQLVKTWELTQEHGLEARGRELFGPDAEPRGWFNTIPAATAPATVNIPDGPAGMGGSALTNEYFDAAWYQLQILVNSGNHRHRDRAPVDWVYLIGRFLDLHRETKSPEPARLLLAVVKSMQSTDPRFGPKDRARGWRPRHNVDPTIMVREKWAPLFQSLPADARRALTETLLRVWLDKNQQYAVADFFTPGVADEGYIVPESLGGIVGGRVWDDAPQFRAAGVSPEIVARLQSWGAAYVATAARFQYSDNSRNRGKYKTGK